MASMLSFLRFFSGFLQAEPCHEQGSGSPGVTIIGELRATKLHYFVETRGRRGSRAALNITNIQMHHGCIILPWLLGPTSAIRIWIHPDRRSEGQADIFWVTTRIHHFSCALPRYPDVFKPRWKSQVHVQYLAASLVLAT